jgi:hypothetical protein
LPLGYDGVAVGEGAVDITRLSPEMMSAELAKFENKYGLTSSEFYDRWRTGEIKESTDFFDWAGLCYMALRNGVLSRTRVGT